MNDGHKRKPQKHQNKTAFKVTFQPHVDKLHSKVSLDDLCKRCLQQMQWKLQFNKYKKMTQPTKCGVCSQKTVYRSYMRACQPCTQQKKICPKCLSQQFEKPENVPQNAKKQQKKQKILQLEMMQFMKKLKQRSRRTIKRGLQKGTITWNQQLKYFVDENGEQLIGLHFRKQGFQDQDSQNVQKLDDIDQFGDDLDDLDDQDF